MYISLHIEDEAKTVKRSLSGAIKSGITRYVSKYISELDKFILMMAGQEKFMYEFDTAQASKEHQSVLKLIKVFTPLNNLYQNVDENDAKPLRDIKERLCVIISLLGELEASLEILSDKELSRQIKEALTDKEQHNKDAFVEWHSKSSK